MPAIRLSTAARADIVALLAWTDEHFGESARERYETLLSVAFQDFMADPARAGSLPRPELGKLLLSYHLRHSRTRVRQFGALVRRPRHLLLYRVSSKDVVDIVRVLHDAMELERHMPADEIED